MKKPADIKICFNTMVKNEAPTIERMLNSVWEYIDYWVIQDNGSEDGTQQIIENFFKEKGIPGFLYQIYEWKGHGWNRDHTLQTALKAEHGCDWILRVDADEQLQVDENFDWSPFKDTSIQSFNITASAGNALYYRTWIWNAKLPWFFAHDLAHETIHLEGVGEDFQRVGLPNSIRHIITNDGMTWYKPMKFLKDALNLELTKVTTNEVLTDDYHLWYIGKSYNDAYGNPSEFPFGIDHAREFARRTIFYFDMYLNKIHDYSNTLKPSRTDDMGYYAMMLIGNAYQFLGNYDLALESYERADEFQSGRNEALWSRCTLLEKMGNYEEVMKLSFSMIRPGSPKNNPFPRIVFLIDSGVYADTSPEPYWMHIRALNKLGKSINAEVEWMKRVHPQLPQHIIDGLNRIQKPEPKPTEFNPLTLAGVFGVTR